MSFAHLTIATRDAEKTSKFFRDIFGWRSLRMPGNVDTTADWLEIAPGQQIHILQVEGFQTSPFEEEYGRHVALFHPASDYARLQRRLQKHCVEIIPAIRETPFSRFFFRDPNGYLIEIIDQDAWQDESA